MCLTVVLQKRTNSSILVELVVTSYLKLSQTNNQKQLLKSNMENLIVLSKWIELNKKLNQSNDKKPAKNKCFFSYIFKTKRIFIFCLLSNRTVVILILIFAAFDSGECCVYLTWNNQKCSLKIWGSSFCRKSDIVFRIWFIIKKTYFF